MKSAIVTGVLALAACSGPSSEEKAEMNAVAANYTPPFVMSRLDFGGVIERRFRRLDKNHDDRLSESEATPERWARWKAFDSNGDGMISMAEWSAGQLKRFDLQDANADGTVTSGERDAARAKRETDLPTPAEEPVTNAS